MSIKPLPEEVVAQIKSSVAITTLNNVITGLVTNSLDAAATKIDILVDYARGNCSVEDNGTGIPPSAFKEDGGLGQLHYTSKYPSQPDTHGRHGAFLASAASLSLLTLTSHHRDFHSHNSLSVHNSTILARNTPCLPEQRVLTFAHGTRVTVRDLFGCMPVRVKHRALQAEKSSFTRDWDRLGLDVVALLTAWPGAVFVSLRDAATQQSLSLKVSSESRNWLKDSCRLLYQASLRDSPAVSDWVPIGISSPTLSISGYVSREPVATKRAQFISLGIEPLSNESRCNVLYEEVNKVFAESSFGLVEDESDQDETPKKTKTDGFTQRELNARKGVDRWPMFFLKMTPTASSLGADDILEGPQPNLTIITGLLKAVFFEFLKRNQCRPRKAVVFTKPKSCSQQEHRRKHRTDDLASAASSKKRQKTTDPILALAGELTRETSRLEILDSRPDLLPVSKIKSGRLLHTFEASAPSRSRTQSICTTPTPSSRDGTPEHITTASRGSMSAEPLRPSLFTADGKLTRRPFDDINSQHAASRSTTQEPTYASMPTEQPAASSAPLLQDETLEWVNPVTKMAATIHSQTDFAMAVAPKSLTLSRRDSEQKSKEAKSGADVPTRESKAASSWVTNLISKWKNPVFELTEPPVPKLPDVADTLGLEPHVTDHRCHHGQSAFTMGTRHETTMMGRQGRFSKDTLKKAQLIAQVDTKFIFAKVLFERTEGSTEDDSVLLELSPVLVLIDQHAADERCRVEELMAGYFKPSAEKNGKQIWEAVTENLQKPVQFELSGQDKDLLRQSQPYFSYWGICYDVEASISSTKDKKTSRSIKVKISVRSLPPAILERCRTDPRLLAELIRREAWRLKDEDKPVHSPKSRPVLPQDLEGRVPVWVSLFHACPPGVLELINSRSCRSAIMFNDPLTLDECSQLLDKLMGCAFPFQCAHGRPSMVPLVDLGTGSMELGNLVEKSASRGGAEPFGQVFTKWKESIQQKRSSIAKEYET